MPEETSAPASTTLPAVVHEDVQTILRQHDGNLLPVFLSRYDRRQTRRAYETDLTQFFGTPYIYIALAQQATFVHVNAHLAQMEADGLKVSTRQRRLSAIRVFFDWLRALKIVEENPADRQLVRRVRKRRSEDAPIVVLTDKQARALVEATAEVGEQSVRDRALIMMLLSCCLRRSEAAAMDAEHIQQAGPYWRLLIPEAKGGADEWVKVPDHLVEEIEFHKEYYGITGGALWRSLSNRNRGGRLHPDSVYRIVQRAAARAGIALDVGAHTLRHTGCTLAIENGASLKQVQAHARHKHVATTMQYVHQRDKLRDSAADYIRY